jgi:hypothetical protein
MTPRRAAPSVAVTEKENTPSPIHRPPPVMPSSPIEHRPSSIEHRASPIEHRPSSIEHARRISVILTP